MLLREIANNYNQALQIPPNVQDAFLLSSAKFDLWNAGHFLIKNVHVITKYTWKRIVPMEMYYPKNNLTFWVSKPFNPSSDLVTSFGFLSQLQTNFLSDILFVREQKRKKKYQILGVNILGPNCRLRRITIV